MGVQWGWPRGWFFFSHLQVALRPPTHTPATPQPKAYCCPHELHTMCMSVRLKLEGGGERAAKNDKAHQTTHHHACFPLGLVGLAMGSLKFFKLL